MKTLLSNQRMIARPDPAVLPAGGIFRINAGIFFEMLHKSPGILIKNNL
jgi:hypothetical protein